MITLQSAESAKRRTLAKNQQQSRGERHGFCFGVICALPPAQIGTQRRQRRRVGAALLMLIQEDVQGGEIMEIKRVKLSEIRPYEKNPRRNDSAVDAVAASIKEFGWQQPIVVDKDGVIIAGHTRYKAAKKLKCKEVPVVYADNLTEEQVKAYRLADNKVGEIANWDFDMLKTELADLADIDFDMKPFDFDFDRAKEQEEENAPESFDEFTGAEQVRHTCPRCGYEWN